MKKMNVSRVKKAAAWMLVLVMALGLLGCGGKDTAKDLYGTWELSYDMGQMISDELGDDYADFNAPLEIKLKFDFNEDGTYKMYVDEAAFSESWDTWKSAFITYMVDMIYAEIEAGGVDRATADEMIQQQYGCTAEEYISQMADESFDVDAMLAEIETSSKYEVKGQKLYLANEGEDIQANMYDHFEVKDDTLTLSLVDESQDAEVLPGLSYPLKFTRSAQ